MGKVIKISDAATLAIHAMKVMSVNGIGTQSVMQMAEKLKVSEAHLAKVLQRLTRAKLVKSVRGPGGGFKLGRGAEKVTLSDIYETIEGPLEIVGCLLGEPVCPESTCELSVKLIEAQEAIKKYLSETTLATHKGQAV
ncbi:MAG: Rrf2 family transcriptional regulator [Myxococcota bacterium]|jgi:Rrf2 family protein